MTNTNKNNSEPFQDLLEQQRSDIMLDMRLLFKRELDPIRSDLTYIRERLDRLFTMESSDIQTAYVEIESLKKKLGKLELRLRELEK